MAASLLTTLSSSSSSSSSLPLNKTGLASLETPKQSGSTLPRSISFQYPRFSCLSLCQSHEEKKRKPRVSSVSAVVNEATAVEEEEEDEISAEDNVSVEESSIKPRPCELYVCNLPRDYDITQLLELFKPHGTVLSVEVSRNAVTGESKGCGHITMSSLTSAKVAIAALDGTDVGGREMRVRFSADMSSTKRNPEVLNSAPKRVLIYESPYKLYVGNLPFSTRPDQLRNWFSKFGTLVSVRILHDRKAGKNRVYGFLSYSSRPDRDAATSLNGTDFLGRKLIVKTGVEKSE